MQNTTPSIQVQPQSSTPAVGAPYNGPGSNQGSTTPAPQQPVTAPTTSTPTAPAVLRYTGTGGSDATAPGQVPTGGYVGEDGNIYDSNHNNLGPQAPQDNAALRTNELNSVQGAVDQVNQNYASDIATTENTNANTVGGARSVNARSGVLGTDFGNANSSAAVSKANANTTKLDQTHATDLNTIYNGIQKDIDSKQTAFQSQADKLTTQQQATYNKNSMDYVKNLASTGASLDSLTQDEYNHIIDSTGMSDNELRAYFAANIPKEKTLSSSIQDGNFVQVTQDPTTGALNSTVTAIPGIPKSEASNYTYDASLQAFVPKSGIDPSKPIADQIKPWASATKTGSASSKDKPAAGYGSVKPSEVTTLQGILDSGKNPDDSPANNGQGQTFAGKGENDGYVDPGLYTYIYQQFIKSGGSNAAFLKSFPVKDVNPDDYAKIPAALSSSSSSSSGSSDNPF